jgi:hypothetical protein
MWMNKKNLILICGEIKVGFNSNRADRGGPLRDTLCLRDTISLFDFRMIAVGMVMQSDGATWVSFARGREAW